MKILILNGPNLNLLGKRQPEVYGSQSMDEVVQNLREQFPEHRLEYAQSNHEGMLIDWLHEAGQSFDGVVFNPGGYAHTSIALADAIRSINVPVVEVHISNIHAREAYRNHSFTAAAAKGLISGFGTKGYALAVKALEMMA
ncbi:MAG: type II 3-dehydroquinate dehydratase [Bacteroidetes bacterium]|nr:type II 3-dehydroquinate dehydratase [Bacteroidota bacterium]